MEILVKKKIIFKIIYFNVSQKQESFTSSFFLFIFELLMPFESGGDKINGYKIYASSNSI